MEQEPRPPTTNTIEPLKIPTLTPEEQAERKRALASILKLRATLPPLEISAAELVRRARIKDGRKMADALQLVVNVSSVL